MLGVQAARESARRAACSNNLRQIGLALANYESTNRIFPYGHARQGFSAQVTLLPFIEEFPRYDLFDPLASVLDPQNQAQGMTSPAVYSCPAASNFGGKSISYFGNGGTGAQDGTNGALVIWRDPLTRKPVGQIGSFSFTDGASHSVIVAEVLINEPGFKRARISDFSPRRNSFIEFSRDCYANAEDGADTNLGSLWIHGDPGSSRYFHVLRPNQVSCLNNGAVQEMIMNASSKHPSGVQVTSADGSVQWVSNSVDLSVWRALGSRNSSESELSL